MKPMAPVIQWYPGTTEQTQRVATVVLVAACIAQLELGLRWLNDRSFWSGIHHSNDSCPMCGKWIDPCEAEVNALELGLRWLHDRASRCPECGALRMYRWADDKPDCLACDELGPIS